MNIFGYLEKLSDNDIQQLYGDPSICQAIFRNLPPLCQNFVMKLLYLQKPVKEENISSWMAQDDNAAKTKMDSALKRLYDLHICSKTEKEKRFREKEKSTEIEIELRTAFRDGFLSSLTQIDTSNWIQSTDPDEQGDASPSQEELDKFSTHYWHSILEFVMGNGNAVRDRSKTFLIVLELLTATGVMHSPRKGTYSITHTGYQFLLKDTYTQLWTLLLAYIQNAEKHELNKREVFSFFFHLDTIAFGQGFSAKELSKTQRKVLEDLRELGIVFQRKQTSQKFFPTRLAFIISAPADSWQIVSGAPSTSSSSNSNTNNNNSNNNNNNNNNNNAIESSNILGGYIIVEANYRAYAYTTEDLMVKILNLFMSLKYRFKNMAAFLITRQSIREALIKGITADQMIHFLQQNAHPENKKRSPVLPDTLTDQLKLWERERNRMSYDVGYLFDSFGDGEAADELFLQVEKFARENGVYIWSQSAPSRKIFVKSEAYEPLRKLIRELSKKAFD